MDNIVLIPYEKNLYLIYIIYVSGYGGKKGAVENCRNCRGSGVQVRLQQLFPGFVQQVQSMCHECKGHGERINPRDLCKTCVGQKTVKERKVLEVHVDKGI